jgi:regulator of protease activity HflC (stomatin/prohibitin superfamily)
VQSAVPPEEVVKHAQMEVQKLEAQAQAQAVAAMQVSAAAQRAEAEAQKHLVVHAQVAAQAQQLQAKAVHLQVRWGLLGVSKLDRRVDLVQQRHVRVFKGVWHSVLGQTADQAWSHRLYSSRLCRCVSPC